MVAFFVLILKSLCTSVAAMSFFVFALNMKDKYQRSSMLTYLIILTCYETPQPGYSDFTMKLEQYRIATFRKFSAHAVRHVF